MNERAKKFIIKDSEYSARFRKVCEFESQEITQSFLSGVNLIFSGFLYGVVNNETLRSYIRDQVNVVSATEKSEIRSQLKKELAKIKFKKEIQDEIQKTVGLMLDSARVLYNAGIEFKIKLLNETTSQAIRLSFSMGKKEEADIAAMTNYDGSRPIDFFEILTSGLEIEIVSGLMSIIDGSQNMLEYNSKAKTRVNAISARFEKQTHEYIYKYLLRVQNMINAHLSDIRMRVKI